MKKKYWLYLSIILGIIFLILLGNFLIKGKSLDPNTKLVQELYSYLGENDLQYCDGLSNYGDTLVDYQKLSNTERLCKAMVRLYQEKNYEIITLDKDNKKDSCSLTENITFALNEDKSGCQVYKIPDPIIEAKYKQIFNEDIQDKEAFNLNNRLVCTFYDGFYYCGDSLTYTITVGADPSTYRAFKDVYQKKDTIVIYDYFLKTIKDECYLTYTGNTKNDLCTKELPQNNLIDYKFLRKYGSLYKHTYAKDANNNYYWVSSEKIK